MNWMRSTGLAVATATMLAASASAQTFSAEEFRALGTAALQAGDVTQAANVANALLARDPNDVVALLLSAQIADLVGDSAAVARFSKRAYWNANNRGNSYVAARLAANAHAAQEQDTLAQLWLRRARQYAPNTAAANSIAKDYVFLRDRNPWSNSLTFGLTPTSNVNGGGYGVTITQFGLPFEAEPPLPGIEISGSLSTTYRIDSTATYATFFDLFANFRTYDLLPEAKLRIPDATGHDFASGALGVGLRHRQIFAEGALPTDFSLRFAQNWSEGVINTRTLDLGLGQRWKVGNDASFGLRFSNQYMIAKDDEPSTYVGLTASWTQAFGDDQLSLSLAGRRSYSDNSSRGYVSRRIYGSYDFGQSFKGLKFGLDFDYDAREFDRPPNFVANDRSDTTQSLTVRVQNENIELYGFQPVVSLTATNVESTVNQFDRDFLNFGFDLRSSF